MKNSGYRALGSVLKGGPHRVTHMRDVRGVHHLDRHEFRGPHVVEEALAVAATLTMRRMMSEETLPSLNGYRAAEPTDLSVVEHVAAVAMVVESAALQPDPA